MYSTASHFGGALSSSGREGSGREQHQASPGAGRDALAQLANQITKLWPLGNQANMLK